MITQYCRTLHHIESFGKGKFKTKFLSYIFLNGKISWCYPLVTHIEVTFMDFCRTEDLNRTNKNPKGTTMFLPRNAVICKDFQCSLLFNYLAMRILSQLSPCSLSAKL